MLLVDFNEYTWYEILIPITFTVSTYSCSMTVELEENYMGVTFTPIFHTDGGDVVYGKAILPIEDVTTGKVLLDFAVGDMPDFNIRMISYIGLHIDNGDTMTGHDSLYIKSITVKLS